MGTGTGAGTGWKRGRGRGCRPVDEHRMGTGTGTGTEARTVVKMGTGTRTGSGRPEEGGRSLKKTQKSCRRHVGNGGDLSEKKKKCRKERVSPVAANPDNLESNKEVGRGAQGSQDSSKNYTSRESVTPLSRLIRGFRNKYH